jgi:hypothetical protein
MLPLNSIHGPQPAANAGKSPVTVTTDSHALPIKLEAGQQLQGIIQARIGADLYDVQIAGHTLRVRLPVTMRNGDSIRLEVTTTRPRITLGLIPSTSPLATSEKISATSQLLANLADLPLERQAIQPGAHAVWQAGEDMHDPKALAGILRETLAQSGLFYESHQAQWVRGERSMNQLLQEPQNTLTGHSPHPDQPSLDNASTLNSEMTENQPPLGTDIASRSIETAPTSHQSGAASTLNQAVLHLVQQQLHTLEHHHLTWTGQIWPGQMMQWEIQGNPEERQTSEQENTRQWSTTLELDLPSLGNVYACIQFSGSSVRLQLRAAKSQTCELLKLGLPRLQHAMADTQLLLLSSNVEHA